MQLILLRHGNTFEEGETPLQIGSQTDLPLTDKGRQQAQHFALYLKKQHRVPKALYAGSLKRQLETVSIVARELGIEESIHLNEEALTELDYGAWEGLSAEQILMQWPQEHEQWSGDSLFWPEALFGRSFDWHLQKIKEWTQKIEALYGKEETAVAVTSQGVLRFFYLLCEQDQTMAKVKTGHFCVLSLNKGLLKIEKWNVNPDASSNS